jgi:hypothetical protein
VNLATDTMMFAGLANELDLDVTDLVVEDLSQALICWAMLEEANRTLAIVRAALGKKLAEEMPEKRVVVDGAGVFERHVKKDRTKWDKEALLSAVLDSRIVNPETGEVTDPTPLDKVLHVWNLGAPRITALRERKIDADEFCEVERGGWTLQLTGAVK